MDYRAQSITDADRTGHIVLALKKLKEFVITHPDLFDKEFPEDDLSTLNNEPEIRNYQSVADKYHLISFNKILKQSVGKHPELVRCLKSACAIDYLEGKYKPKNFR